MRLHFRGLSSSIRYKGSHKWSRKIILHCYLGNWKSFKMLRNLKIKWCNFFFFGEYTYVVINKKKIAIKHNVCTWVPECLKINKIDSFSCLCGKPDITARTKWRWPALNCQSSPIRGVWFYFKVFHVCPELEFFRLDLKNLAHWAKMY